MPALKASDAHAIFLSFNSLPKTGAEKTHSKTLKNMWSLNIIPDHEFM
jgi:hypothetical protein